MNYFLFKLLGDCIICVHELRVFALLNTICEVIKELLYIFTITFIIIIFINLLSFLLIDHFNYPF